MTSASQAHVASLRIRNLLLLVTTGLLWGTQPSLIKALTGGGLPQVATLGLAMTVVALALAAALAWRGRPILPSRRNAVFVIIAGVTEYAGPLLAAFIVAKHIDAGLLTMIMFTTPIIAVPAAAAFGVEPLDRYVVLGSLSGAIGIALIALPQNALPSPEMLPWSLAAFCVPVMYGLGSVYVSKAWPAGMDATQVAFGGALLAAVALLPFWIGPLAAGRYAECTALEYVLFLALAGSIIVEMVLFFYAVRHAGPVLSSFGNFLAILTGFVVGGLFFGEKPSIWVWASVAFFSLALALVLLRPTRPDPDA